MKGPDILCVGMVVVDVLVQGFESAPRAGETGLVTSVSLAAGGDAANQAMSLAKLGNNVGLMGLIGDDVQGQLLQDRCARLKVDARGLFVDPARPTSTGVVLVDRQGERSFLSSATATSAQLAPEHIRPELIGPGLRVLSVGSLFYAPRFDQEALAPLLRQAKAAGAITIADLVMDQRDYGLQGLRDAWPHLDYVVPSELEARLFTGSEEPEAIARAFRAQGVKNVILKRGGKGVTAFIGNEVFTCPAFNVPAVDTTGAGDNFVAGLIHGLVQGLAPAEALRFGSAVAALSIQAVGAGAGLKNLSQVKAFLQSAVGARVPA